MYFKYIFWISFSCFILGAMTEPVTDNIVATASSNQVLAAEREALMQLYESSSIPDDSTTVTALLFTGDPFTEPIPQKVWRNDNLWGSREPVDKWFGVTTDTVSGKVTKLMLQGNNLRGPISDLSTLSQLTELDLRANNINGPIPTSIGFLTSLTHLYLSANFFSGKFLYKDSRSKTTGNLVLFLFVYLILSRWNSRNNWFSYKTRTVALIIC